MLGVASGNNRPSTTTLYAIIGHPLQHTLYVLKPKTTTPTHLLIYTFDVIPLSIPICMLFFPRIIAEAIIRVPQSFHHAIQGAPSPHL